MDLSKLLKCAFLLYVIKNALFLALLIYDIIAWAISLGKPACNQPHRRFLLGAWISLLVYEIIQLWKMALLGQMVRKNDYYLMRRALLKVLYLLEALLVLFFFAWLIFGHAITYKTNNTCRDGTQYYQNGTGQYIVTQNNYVLVTPGSPLYYNGLNNNGVVTNNNGVVTNNNGIVNNGNTGFLTNGNNATIQNVTTTNTTFVPNTYFIQGGDKQAWVATIITLCVSYILAPLICLQLLVDTCSHIKSWEVAGGQPNQEVIRQQPVLVSQPVYQAQPVYAGQNAGLNAGRAVV